MSAKIKVKLNPLNFLLIKNSMINKSWIIFLTRFNLIFCLFIIVWGAWVRLSHSGAGCGEHWPLCDGQVIPQAPDYKKFIEFTHRATSGLFGLTVLLQATLSFIFFKKGHPVRMSAFFIVFLTVIESLIGAFLVKNGLVADNQSKLRAVVISFHLVNTFFLLAALSAGDFFSRKVLTKMRLWTKWEKIYWWSCISLLIIVGACGAVAALGHTLFPSESLMEGIRADFDSGSHWLIRLRVFHPLFALVSVLLMLIGTYRWKDRGAIPVGEGQLFLCLLIGQLFLGCVNWVLLAPHWSALIHLFFADLIWIGFIRQGFNLHRKHQF